jgi:hypothetical protein
MTLNVMHNIDMNCGKQINILNQRNTMMAMGIA